MAEKSEQPVETMTEDEQQAHDAEQSATAVTQPTDASEPTVHEPAAVETKMAPPAADADADDLDEPEPANDAEDLDEPQPSDDTVAAQSEGETAPADSTDTSVDSESAEDETPDEEGEDEDDYREERVVVVRRGIFYSVAAVAILVIAVLAGLNVYQFTKSNDPAVAIVNGTKIPRSQYDKIIASTDNGAGQTQAESVVDQLINNTLLEQDAAKQHVTASPDEIDAALKSERASAGLTSDSDYQNALAQAHITETQLRAQLKDTVLLQKLVLNKVSVSEDEITQEYNQNKDTTYQGKQLSDVHDQIKATLLQQKQQTAEQTYFDNLQAKAKITRHIPGA